MSLKRPHLLFLIVLFIPFFKPVGLTYYPIFNRIYQLWKLAVIMYILLYFVNNFISSHSVLISFKRYLNRGAIGLGIFWLIYIFNCLRYENSVGDIANNAVTSIILFEFIQYAAGTKWKMKMLQALYYIFLTYLFLYIGTFLFIIISGQPLFEPVEGQYTFFLGRDNYTAFITYPMLGIVLFYENLKRGDQKISIGSWMLLFAVTFSYIYVKSMTAAFVGLTFILALSIRQHRRFFLNCFTPRTIIMGTGILFILIYFFNIQYAFSNLFINILGKGLTLNSRTIIWEAACKLIVRKPIFGYGELSQLQVENYILYGTSHAHNLFVELLLRAGIVGMIGYLQFILGFAKRNKKTFYKKNWSVGILIIALAVQIMLFFMDFYVIIQAFYCFMAVLYTANEYI